jgi:hypothetical protein
MDTRKLNDLKEALDSIEWTCRDMVELDWKNSMQDTEWV